MEEERKGIELLITTLKQISEFNQWLVSKQNHIDINTFYNQIITTITENNQNNEITIHQFLVLLQEKINKIPLTDEEEGCPMNGILITTNQCLPCNTETTKSDAPMFITIKRNEFIQMTSVQRAIVTFLEAHYCKAKQCEICGKDLMVINEYLFEPKILCVELSHLDLSLDINKHISINSKEYECISVLFKRNNIFYSLQKIENNWIGSDESITCINETDDIQFTFYQRLPHYLNDL